MKKIILILIAGVIVSGLSACMKSVVLPENVIRDEVIRHIQSDKTTYSGQKLFDDESLTFTDFFIEERTTNKKMGFERICGFAQANDDNLFYMFQYCALSEYDKSFGWKIVSTEIEDISVSPRRGVQEATIRRDLGNERFNVGTDTWKINEESQIAIVSQKTDLKEGKDLVTVQVTIPGNLMQATGEYRLEYRWDTMQWKYIVGTVTSHFSATYRDGMAPKLTEENILAVLADHPIGITEFPKQEVVISNDAVRNLSLGEPVTSEYGYYCTQPCSFRLNKGFAALNVKSEVQFHFQNGEWNARIVSYDARLISVNIIDTWKGSAADDTDYVLTIQTQDSDGEITAICEFTPDAVNSDRKPGSYKMIGRIDMETLKVTLKATEWIECPPDATGVDDMNLVILLDDNQLSGSTSFRDGWGWGWGHKIVFVRG